MQSNCFECGIEIIRKSTGSSNYCGKCLYKRAKKIIQCPQCNKSILSKNLNKHINDVHLKIKKFKCEYCDFKCSQKQSLPSHSCYRRHIDSNQSVSRGEDYIQKKLEEKTEGKKQKCPIGEIDILSKTELIEIKLWNEWKKGIGQLMTYGYYFSDKQKRIHFFGPTLKNEIKIEIEKILTSLNIIMTIEPEIKKEENNITDWSNLIDDLEDFTIETSKTPNNL